MHKEDEEDQIQSGNDIGFKSDWTLTQPRIVIETVSEIGDGLHANIYLARKLEFDKDQKVNK